jgi:hypothetical protein
MTRRFRPQLTSGDPSFGKSDNLNLSDTYRTSTLLIGREHWSRLKRREEINICSRKGESVSHYANDVACLSVDAQCLVERHTSKVVNGCAVCYDYGTWGSSLVLGQ